MLPVGLCEWKITVMFNKVLRTFEGQVLKIFSEHSASAQKLDDLYFSKQIKASQCGCWCGVDPVTIRACLQRLDL